MGDTAATYAVCVNNSEYPASLEVGKIYRTLPDTAAKHRLIRVIDESGEDYLYPDVFFFPIELPPEIAEALAY